MPEQLSDADYRARYLAFYGPLTTLMNLHLARFGCAGTPDVCLGLARALGGFLGSAEYVDDGMAEKAMKSVLEHMEKTRQEAMVTLEQIGGPGGEVGRG